MPSMSQYYTHTHVKIPTKHRMNTNTHIARVSKPKGRAHCSIDLTHIVSESFGCFCPSWNGMVWLWCVYNTYMHVPYQANTGEYIKCFSFHYIICLFSTVHDTGRLRCFLVNILLCFRLCLLCFVTIFLKWCSFDSLIVERDKYLHQLFWACV